MSVEFNIIENDSKGFETAMEKEMAKPMKHFEIELAKVRTGKAHTSMIEDLKISCYGQSPMPLKTMAVLAAPDAKLLTIQPWDSSIIGDIEKGINESDLGLKAENDGKLIRLRLPEMSSTRRDELVKILNAKLEECKVGIRNVRQEFNNIMRDSKKNKKISEDFYNRLEDSLKKVTDKITTQANTLSEKKEKEIRTV
ncbi:MAG: Ribosome-recycling factor [candidate division TM6 bacterium GW2011_GWF2_30_66]|nr:MAG: Ribosome-recycling factor [candidate division TM6 bacterium GW2011_GWF2_30_66]